MTRRFRMLLLFLLVPAILLAADFPATESDLTIAMSAAELARLGDPAERRLRVGVTKEVNAQIDLSRVRPDDLGPAPVILPFGRIQRTAGGFAWTAAVDSPGAVGIRLHFANFYLPRNATLTLSNALGEAFTYADRGPGGSGEFWSNTLRGDRVDLRIEYAGNDLGRVLQAIRVLLAEIGPLGPNFPSADPQAGDELCPYNEPCVVNASCTTLPAAVSDAQKAVAMILFVSGAFQYICSGGLVADADPSSDIPYFLTANHCLSKSSEAASLEAYFDYTSPCGTCDDSISDEPRTLGSSIVATNRTSDFTLLRLSEAAPAGTAFLRTNNTPIANTNGVALFRISHPAGAPQAYSEHRVDTSRPTCRSWPRGDWIYSSDVFGATEGGSSGSPVVNSAGEVVGQLSGACGFNVNDPCDSAQNATVDGALAAYWSQVEPFLGGGGSCTDADGDGYCATDDCNDQDASVNPGATENCGDGVDNDCNGLVDSSDPACQTGGCDLGGSGAPCTDNSQCCSGNCKGKPGSRTCK